MTGAAMLQPTRPATKRAGALPAPSTGQSEFMDILARWADRMERQDAQARSAGQCDEGGQADRGAQPSQRAA